MKYAPIWGQHNIILDELYARVSINYCGDMTAHVIQPLSYDPNEDEYYIRSLTAQQYYGGDKTAQPVCHEISAEALGVVGPTISDSRVLPINQETGALLRHMGSAPIISHSLYCDLFENVNAEKWWRLHRLWAHRRRVSLGLSI